MTQQPDNVNIYTGRADRAAAPQPHVAIHFGGLERTCEFIESLSVSGGRSDKISQADPATLSATMKWYPGSAQMPQLGEEVRVVGWAPGTPRVAGMSVVPLFHGDITDIAVEDNIVSIVAVEPIRHLDGVFIGDAPWPSELLYERIERIVALAKSALGDPVWMPAQLLSQGTRNQPWARARAIERDVDRQRAKEMLEHETRHGLASFYYKLPDFVPESQEKTFTGMLTLVDGIRSVSMTGASIPRYGVPCGLIGEDPPPRYWLNYTGVVNSWKLRCWEQKDVEAQVEVHDAASQAAYGPRAASIATDLLHRLPANDQGPLAAGLLALTKTPYWCVDNVTVYVIEQLRGGVDVHQWQSAMQMAGSPGRHGEPRYFDLDRGQDAEHANMPVLMIENKTVDWRPDGWEITVATSHPKMYDAAFTGLGPDPTRHP